MDLVKRGNAASLPMFPKIIDLTRRRCFPVQYDDLDTSLG